MLMTPNYIYQWSQTKPISLPQRQFLQLNSDKAELLTLLTRPKTSEEHIFWGWCLVSSISLSQYQCKEPSVRICLRYSN